MKDNILERLFYNLVGDKQLYEEHIDREASERFSSDLKALNLNFNTRNNLEEQLANAAELHGFEQGLKIGLRLIAFTIGDQDTQPEQAGQTPRFLLYQRAASRAEP